MWVVIGNDSPVLELLNFLDSQMNGHTEHRYTWLILFVCLMDFYVGNISNIKVNRKVDNLTRDERKALRDLRSDSRIVIKPADKGSAVVIQDRETYIVEGQRQLNTNAYKKTSSDPTIKHAKKVTSVVNKTKVDDKTKEFLSPDIKAVKCPQFYLLPKLHKINTPEGITPGVIPPGRPIISGRACPTTQISRFLDFHLRPLVENLPSYIQDTTHFLRHIDDLNQNASFPPNIILVAADVTSLYTNTDQGEGLMHVKHILRLAPTKILQPII